MVQQGGIGLLTGSYANYAVSANNGAKVAVEKVDSTSGETLAKAMTELTVMSVTGKMIWDTDGNTGKPASAILYYDGVGTLFDD